LHVWINLAESLTAAGRCSARRVEFAHEAFGAGHVMRHDTHDGLAIAGRIKERKRRGWPALAAGQPTLDWEFGAKSEA
jgi:hypothetical protein